MLTVRVTPYNSASVSARDLAISLRGLYSGSPEDTDVKSAFPTGGLVASIAANGFNTLQSTASNKKAIINWGASPLATVARPGSKPGLLTFNTVTEFGDYTNKKNFFRRFADNSSAQVFFPRWWDNVDDVNAARPSYSAVTDRPIIVERHTLTGHSGEGIRLLGINDAPDPAAKMWTKYIPKSREFRVHFFKNWVNPSVPVMKISEKLLRKSVVANPSPGMYQVRNWQNGWIFATHLPASVPSSVVSAAKKFISDPSMTLDFGALDIIYNKRAGASFILEVNTAPGIEGKSLTWYAKTFKLILDNHAYGSGVSRPHTSLLEQLAAAQSSYALSDTVDNDVISPDSDHYL